MIVTIDGPSGTGKSTVAKLLARRLQFSFFDTGALYRALAWWMLQEEIELHDLISQLERFSFSIQEEGEEKKYFVCGKEVTAQLRNRDVTLLSSKASTIKEVREALLPMQREYARAQDVVFEGRDLGTVVFPSADVKVFLTAREDIRANRRYQEILQKDPTKAVDRAEVMRELQQRDFQDENRSVAPLRCPDHAFVLDTSDLTIADVVETLYQHILIKKSTCKDG